MTAYLLREGTDPGRNRFGKEPIREGGSVEEAAEL
jgi:hypothetical protein